MKVNDELTILELPLSFGGATRIMNLSLITDEDHGLTIVDTGVPGQIDLIEKALEAEGFALADIKHIVITHQDFDHIGSLHPLKERTGAPVYALDIEVPYIEGRLRSVKYPSPERLAQMPEFAAALESLQRSTVDVQLTDGQTLDNSAGAQVVATPGHTLGHMSLYLPRTKTLIVGDAMVSDSGKLDGPMEQATPDMATAKQSVAKLAELDVDTILCYHGGLVTDDASGQLKQVAAS